MHKQIICPFHPRSHKTQTKVMA